MEISLGRLNVIRLRKLLSRSSHTNVKSHQFERGRRHEAICEVPALHEMHSHEFQVYLVRCHVR